MDASSHCPNARLNACPNERPNERPILLTGATGRWHAETEAEIVRSGRPYTFFRPYCFMQNLVAQIDRIRESGLIQAAVGPARIALVDVRDIAEVVASTLSGQTPMPNETRALTGPAALNYREIAAVFSEALGRPVSYQEQTLDAVRQRLAQSNLPPWRAEQLLSFTRAFAEGQASQLDDTIAKVLARPPRSLRQVLDDALKTPRRTGPLGHGAPA